MGPLWEATRDLHHACEAHVVGAAMAGGAPPIEWYAQWLQALRTIHSKVDPTLPPVLHRVARLEQDLLAAGEDIPDSQAAAKYADSLHTDAQLAGAAYVLTGAHLMGGEIMRRRLTGYPTAHLEWDDRPAALGELKLLRQRPDITQAARDCFAALLAVMDEIVEGV
jgi:heme oxygenase